MSKTFTAQNPATGQSFGPEIIEWDQTQTNNAIKAADAVKVTVSANNAVDAIVSLLEIA